MAPAGASNSVRRTRRKPPPTPIYLVLEYLGAVDVPRVVGSGHRKMLCAFHSEKTPSASVSEYGFNCFSCEVSGDAIKLLKTKGGMDFEAALKLCQEFAGGTGESVSQPSGFDHHLFR